MGTPPALAMATASLSSMMVSSKPQPAKRRRPIRGPEVAPEEVPQVPIAESIRHPQLTPLWLDRFKPWLIGAGALLVIAYGPQLVDQIVNMDLNAPGPDITPW